jgi:hypothetical protein
MKSYQVGKSRAFQQPARGNYPILYIAPWLPLVMRNRTSEAKEQGRSPKQEEVERIRVSLGQQEFTF